MALRKHLSVREKKRIALVAHDGFHHLLAADGRRV
jgi:hypothetical protein